MARSHAGRARGGSSRFVGVSWSKAQGRWSAHLAGAYLGQFDTEDEAFSVYREAFRERYGEDVPDGAVREDHGLPVAS
jgi:hypothetical protein